MSLCYRLAAACDFEGQLEKMPTLAGMASSWSSSIMVDK